MMNGYCARAMVLSCSLAMTSIAIDTRAQPAPAAAQAEPSAADRDTARKLVAVGNEQMQQQDFAGALEAYQQAHAIMRVPTTGLLLADAQEKTGRLVEAYDTLVQVTLHAPRPTEPPAFANAREVARGKLPLLEPRIPSLRVSLASTPGVDAAALKNIEIRVDDAVIAGVATKLPRKINPGLHEVSATATGYRALPQSFRIAEAEEKTIELQLVPAPIEPPPLAVEPPPPVPPAPPLPPPHFPFAGEPKTPAARPYKSAVVLSSFSVGALGLLVGAITGGVSLKAASLVKANCPSYPNNCPEDARPDADRSIALANASNATLAIGAAGIVAGVLTLVLIPGPMFAKQEKAPKRGLFPVLGPAALGAYGRF